MYVQVLNGYSKETKSSIKFLQFCSNALIYVIYIYIFLIKEKTGANYFLSNSLEWVIVSASLNSMDDNIYF